MLLNEILCRAFNIIILGGKNQFVKLTYKYLLLYYLNHRWFRNPFDRTRVRIGKSKFIVPIAKGIGLANIKLEEKWMDKILEFILPEIKERFFLDVGVNLGQTLLKVKAISLEINYIRFEPNPKCVNYVNKLVKVNKLQNIKIITAGLSNKTGVFDLIQYDGSGVDASASIVEGFRSNSASIESVVILEPSKITLLENIKVGCIKIDVEGSELEVLQGLSSYIARDSPLIICEILSVYNNENIRRIERQRNVIRLLKSLSYNIYRINIETFKLENVREIEIHSSLDLSNYIFAPADSPLFSRYNLDS